MTSAPARALTSVKGPIRALATTQRRGGGLIGAAAPDDLERFVRAQRRTLVGYLQLQTGSVEVAEELAGDAIVRLCERWETVRSMDNPGGWLLTVAVNLARSRWRRRAAERRAYARHGPTVDRAVEPHAETRDVVHQALHRLAPRRREVVVLRYWVGLSTRQTAAVLGSSETATTTLLSRALDDLRRQLGDDVARDHGEVHR